MLSYNYRTLEEFKDKAPKRIISLVPSQTELLFDLGLNEEVVGITKFCVHPDEWFGNKQRIGGTKNINVSKILSLQPDLIIANKEENVKKQVDELSPQIPVYVSEISNLDEALDMIRDVGQLTHTMEAATAIINTIQNNFNDLNDESAKRTAKCAYLIWKDPYMTIGHDTFIHNMLQYCGLTNAFGHLTRYPEICIENLAQEACEYILLSSEPYPFKEKHIVELKKDLPDAKIILVDGEMFSWYGSRLMQAPAYFKKTIDHAANA
jgi:ABC-type Fe3+-hydroxamate transport system substrate-binding protein